MVAEFKQLKNVDILGVRVTSIRVDELHQRIATFIHDNRHVIIANVNVQCMNLAYHLPWLRAFLNSAEINFCDGAGIRLGAKLLGYQLPPRITYADWMWQLAAFASANDFTLYFLGGKPYVAEKAAQILEDSYPDLCIVGCQHGYFDKSADHPENKAVIEAINSVQPDILIIGFGMPLQENWLVKHWDQLDANVALPGGAVFDYVSGRLPRAPKWMTKNGLEWLGRLFIEPERLWRRYIIGNPLFLWRVLKQRFENRFSQ